jgi:hypothetical protein
MDVRKTLVRMLNQLVEDMQAIHQQGAGYYSCVPFARRFNKLLGQAVLLFPADANGLIGTFEEWPENDAKDPGEKYATVQGIRLEVGQLIALLESVKEEVDQ